MTRSSRLAAAVLAAALLAGCGDTGAGRAKGVAAAPPGRGSVSFSYGGDRSGSYTASGALPLDEARRPQHGTWAAALPQDARNLGITVSRAATEPLADIFLIGLHDVTSPGTYPLDDGCSLDTRSSCAQGLFAFGFDFADASQQPSPSYRLVSGSVTVTRFDARRVQGTFTVSGVRTDVSAGDSISLTGGSFDVPVVANTIPVRGGPTPGS